MKIGILKISILKMIFSRKYRQEMKELVGSINKAIDKITEAQNKLAEAKSAENKV